VRRVVLVIVASVVVIAGTRHGAVEAEENGATPAPASTAEEPVATYQLLYQLQRYPEAIEAAEQALAAAEVAFGTESEQAAQVLNDLGFLHHRQGQEVQAETSHQRALAIREHLFNSDGPAVVQSLNNLAKVYRAQGRHEKATELFKRSLEITERHVSPTDPFLVTVLEPYAASLRASGKIKDAQALEERARAIRAALPSQ